MKKAPFDAGIDNFHWDVDGTGLYLPKTVPLAGVPRIFDQVTTQTSVSNTAAETSVYSCTVPGSVTNTAGAVGYGLGLNGCLHSEMWGEVLNNTAGAVNFQFRVKFGGVTVQNETIALPLSAVSHRFWRFVVRLWNRNATNAQIILSQMFIGAPGVPPGGGGGTWFTNGTYGGTFGGAALTVDTTVNQTFQVTVQHGVASPNVQTLCEYADAEIRRVNIA